MTSPTEPGGVGADGPMLTVTLPADILHHAAYCCDFWARAISGKSGRNSIPNYTKGSAIRSQIMLAEMNRRAPAAEAGEGLAAFDVAVDAELQRVSHVPYDSHEICKHFAGELRKRLAATNTLPPPPQVKE